MEKQEKSDKMEKTCDLKLEQPEEFELELDLVRWIKQCIASPDPPVMVKPSGPVSIHYGLDSKSR